MSSLTCAEQTAYYQIREWILNGRLAPGTRLFHRTLARELGMSPTPVVLALRILNRDGLVINTPGLGACVRVWTREEIVDSYHFRTFLEALAARLCAERADFADIAAIEEAHRAVKKSINEQDAVANVRAELDFHIAISRGAHCSDLEHVFENMAIIHRSVTAFGAVMGVPRLLNEAVRNVHAPIVAAIKNREPDAAEKAAREHVEDSLARNLAWIERVSSTTVDANRPYVCLQTNKAAQSKRRIAECVQSHVGTRSTDLLRMDKR